MSDIYDPCYMTPDTFNFVFKKLKKIYVYEYFECLYPYLLCVCLVPEKSRRFSGNGVIDVGELHFGPWKLNLGSLEKQLFNH